jgi:Cu(I)/Ag(I) efflux system membrane fusion protein
VVLLGGISTYLFWPAKPLRSTAVSSTNPIVQANVPMAALDVTEVQRQAVTDFFKVADRFSSALADDKLDAFNATLPGLDPAVDRLEEAFPTGHTWRPIIQHIRQARLMRAGDLAEARTEFLGFSKATVDFARVARQQNQSFKELKIYRCPMAAKPGVWIQTNGPLRNPYFGEEMLDCGTEMDK